VKKRKRNYKAEYARRIKRGLARGLTPSQARGHPKRGEKPASRITAKARARYYEFPDDLTGFDGKETGTYDENLELLRQEFRYDPDRFTEIAELLDETLTDTYTLWLYL